MYGQKVFIELVGAGAIGHWRAFFPDNKDRKQMFHALTHEQVKDHLIDVLSAPGGKLKRWEKCFWRASSMEKSMYF